MTNKKPQDKAENAVNNAVGSSKTTETKTQAQTLPQAGALKERFKAGSIPLQIDFANVIDLADIGRRTVGGAEGQTGPANGFILSSEGRLELKTNIKKGIKVDESGLAVIPGRGIEVTAEGIRINDEFAFKKGMVMMFAGTVAEIPKGWALCDGKNSTPNLVDRFILGSLPANSNMHNASELTKNPDGIKNCFRPSTSVEVTGTIIINETKLNEDQIPAHNHIGGTRYSQNSAFAYGSQRLAHLGSVGITALSYDGGEHKYQANTSTVGSGKGHSHTGTVKNDKHLHTIDILPPYYSLAFIIKL